MTKRQVSLPSRTKESFQAFINEVDEQLSGTDDICKTVESILVELHGDQQAYRRWQRGDDISWGERLRLRGYDPCNVTLESEYYAEVEAQREEFERAKHLQWLWRQFDATPLADNIAFALQFRRILAKHLFDEAGENLRLFKGVTFTYGHNIELGDNVVIHDNVHLDDRGTLTVGDRVSISDDVHVYTHDHDIVDQTAVTNYHTIIEDDVRLTYDSMVRAGVRIDENAILAAKSIASTDIPAHHIAAGQPAKSLAVKDGWENVTEPLNDTGVDRRQERIVTYEIPTDIDHFDEFHRDLRPPDDQ